MYTESLEEMENDFWGIPAFDSPIIVECYRLRKIPVSHLKPKDIRLLISQEIGLPILVPISLDLLEDNPLIIFEDFRGDLLKTLCHVKQTYWNQNQEQYVQYRFIAAKALEDLLSSEYVDQADYSLVQELRRSL